MNRTIEDSRKMVTLVGGQTIPQEDGKIVMPPQNAKNAKEVINNIEMGNFQEIKTGNCRAEDVLSKKQIEILRANREERKTKRAVVRRKEANLR